MVTDNVSYTWEDISAMRDNRIENTDDILRTVNFMREDWEKKSREDSSHSVAFYGIILDLINRFEKEISHALILDITDNYCFDEEWWTYGVSIKIDGIILQLWHESASKTSDSEDDYDYCIDACYDLIRIPAKQLTVDEYAKAYGVEPVTVRQWIRRGKLRTAKKYGKEWRIPELAECSGRGYKTAVYSWERGLVDFPDEYCFMNEYRSATIAKDSAEKDEYTITLWGNGTLEPRTLHCDAKEKEKIELMFISHPLINYCLKDIMNYD